MQMKWRSLAHAAAGTKGTRVLGGRRWVGYIYPVGVWNRGLYRTTSNWKDKDIS